KLNNVALSTVLRKVLERIPSTSGTTWLIRNGEVEITTARYAAAEKAIVAYPIADLVIPITNTFQQANTVTSASQLFGFGGAGGIGGLGGLGGGLGGLGGGLGGLGGGIGGLGGVGGVAGAPGLAGIAGGGVAGVAGVAGFQGLAGAQGGGQNVGLGAIGG